MLRLEVSCPAVESWKLCLSLGAAVPSGLEFVVVPYLHLGLSAAAMEEEMPAWKQRLTEQFAAAQVVVVQET